jgi:hypothetical protein
VRETGGRRSTVGNPRSCDTDIEIRLVLKVRLEGIVKPFYLPLAGIRRIATPFTHKARKRPLSSVAHGMSGLSGLMAA